MSIKNDHVNILIVEDSPTQAEQLRYLLEKNDFRVTVAVNGREALDRLMEQEPDVVITDVMMPVMDGYELCRQIRGTERLKNLPVVLVTTLSDPTDVIKGLEVGANNFLTKPYDEKYLVSRIQYLIANTELRRNSKAEMGINVFFSGANYFITAERLQILDLLLSTYENAYNQNRELLAVQKELTELNMKLEDMVLERTAELSAANERLRIELAEKLRAEEEKASLQAQLHQAQKMESVGRLAGGVAHDYNNMLSVILGYTQMALQQTDPESPLHQDLQEVLSAANRSTGITRQLLAFARKQALAPQVLDLNETVRSMINMLRKLIGEDITLHWNPTPDLRPVMIDPSQLDQVLANLCVNARDSIRGVGEIRIETGMVCFESGNHLGHFEVMPGEYLFLSVNDSGCGMDEDMLDKIFDPFFTTKELGQGTGLGLSTVYGIVKQHNGFVDVESKPGKGTRFRVYLPCYLGEAGQAEAQQTGNVKHGQGQTILVVEDEQSILKLTSRMLEPLGYRVLAARNPSEAISLAEKQVDGIDLLLSDVIMPEMNGQTLAERILALHPGLKYLFMSGYTANVIESQGGVDVGSHLIQKPFTAKELAAKVREFLAGSSFPLDQDGFSGGKA